MTSGHDDCKKKVIHATICAPAADALRAFCVRHGVTITAFLDGFAHALPDSADDCEFLPGALRNAREIDADRRRREPVS